MKYRPKFGFDIRIKPPQEGARPVEPKDRTCEWPKCKKSANHKAPKNRQEIRSYRWFCLDHVREYNKSWNFFEGMNDRDVEAFQDASRTGHRPTWTMGAHPWRPEPNGHAGAAKRWFETGLHTEDPLGLGRHLGNGHRVRVAKRRLTRAQEEAFGVFNLDPAAEPAQIKARYKELVKRFHPDANHGETGYEERLKRVIDAYHHLKAGGFC